MEISQNRLKHILKVAERMQKIVKENKEEFSISPNDAFILGFLHDVWYGFSDNSTHNIIWWKQLETNNYKYWKEVYYHWEINIKYKSKELDLLNYVDMTTSPEWKIITIDERCFDIWERYGKTSEAYKKSIILKKYLENIEWLKKIVC